MGRKKTQMTFLQNSKLSCNNGCPKMKAFSPRLGDGSTGSKVARHTSCTSCCLLTTFMAAALEYSRPLRVTVTPPSSSKTSSGPSTSRQSMSSMSWWIAGGTFRASWRWSGVAAARGAPMREVPVSAMATQEPSAQKGNSWESRAARSTMKYHCRFFCRFLIDLLATAGSMLGKSNREASSYLQVLQQQCVPP